MSSALRSLLRPLIDNAKSQRNKSASRLGRRLSIESLEKRMMLSATQQPHADFNSDTTVDASDLAIWEVGFGTGTSQAQGDADLNGQVNGADFLAWQRGFGSSVTTSQNGAVAVPDYYISPGGDDNGDGSASSPWRTIGKANNTLQPGEAVEIMAGTYDEMISPLNSGTSDTQRITY